MLPEWVNLLVNFGALGLVLLLILTGHLATGARVRWLEQENQRLNGVIESKDRQIADLNKTFTDRVVPVMERLISFVDMRGRI